MDSPENLRDELAHINNDFQAAIKKTETEYKQTLSRKPPAKSILLGTNQLSGQKVYLPEKARRTHMHIIGGTGMGKSKFLENMIRQDIEQRNGLILLDGKGDLYDSLLNYVTRRRLKDRAILIDPNDSEWAVGINYLELFGEATPDTLTELVMAGLAKIFGDDQEYKPRLDHWGPMSIGPLIKAKLTLLELTEFLNVGNTTFRKAVLSKLETGIYTSEWEEFQNLRKQDQVNMLEVVRNRAMRFWTSPAVKLIVGQTKTAIDWVQAMDEGKVILVNLKRSDRISEKMAQMLGIIIMHQIVQNATLRPKGRRRPFYVYVDEFQKFVCHDFVDALQLLRGFGIFLILANQELQQLKRESPDLYSAVMTNADNKMAFSISREDAENMALEIFTGYIRGDRIKNIIKQTKFWPKKTTLTVVADGYSHTDTHGTSFENSSGSVSSQLVSQTLIPGEDILSSESLMSTTHASGLSLSHGQSRGQSESSASGETHLETKVPWYEYEPFQEISTKTFWTIQEIVEKYIAWIHQQNPRHAQLRLAKRKPIPIVVPTIEDVRVRQKDVDQLKLHVYKKYALPAKKAEALIARRREDVIALPDISDTQDEDMVNEWE